MPQRPRVLEAPAEDGGYTTAATPSRPTGTSSSPTTSTRAPQASAPTRPWTPNGGPDWGVPDATSDNQLGLVPDRWLYVYKLDSKKGGNQNGITQP